VKNVGDFNADDVRYIRTPDNRIIAVGAMACSSKDLEKNGATGTCIYVLHMLDDTLWATGPKVVLKPAIPTEIKSDDTTKPKEEAK